MIWVIRRLFQDFRHWERLTQIAFILALILLPIATVMILSAPQHERINLVFGFGALIFVTQMIVLWGNRTMITPYTQAQRFYLAGDFEQTRTLLENVRESGKADMRVLTLLGNTYRQLGMLSESEMILYEALDKAPNNHFPLYNFGRTLLSMGRFDEAVEVIQRALDEGAPAVTRFDLAEAFFMGGKADQARDMLLEISPTLLEPHRALMAKWWLYQFGVGEHPSTDLIIEGLPYWEAASQRFQHTLYGKQIGEIVGTLQALNVER